MESERASEADEVFTSEVPATHSQATKPAIKADVDTIRTHLQRYAAIPAWRQDTYPNADTAIGVTQSSRM